MNIDIKDFLDFATYHGMLDGITITEYPAIISSLRDFYMGPIPSVPPVTFLLETDNTNTILWTYNGWINECKRRKDLVDSASIKPVAATPNQSLNDKIRKAILADDWDKVLQLKGQNK